MSVLLKKLVYTKNSLHRPNIGGLNTDPRLTEKQIRFSWNWVFTFKSIMYRV